MRLQDAGASQSSTSHSGSETGQNMVAHFQRQGILAGLRIEPFLALTSRRFHGQNSDNESENSGHGLLKAVIKPSFTDAAKVRPNRCGIEEWWLPWPE